jgi:hypothetical protein
MKKQAVKFDEVAESLAMMQEPNRWPKWPVLPVKRRHDKGGPECGLMIEGRPTVYIANMFTLTPGALMPQLETTQSFGYPSYNDLVNDGWIVD